MTSQPSPLNELLPELYPIIAAHLPLYSTPSTLLSLALVNHHISEIVLPLLHSCLILKNETDALKVIQKLLDEPELGKVVREIHVLSSLSLATRSGENTIDVVTGLEKLITATSLPYIHTLSLHLLHGWYYHGRYRSVFGFGQLRSAFWVNLKKNCPRLRGLLLKNIPDKGENPQCISDSDLLEIQDITSFKLSFLAEQEARFPLLETIDPLFANLHTLELGPHDADWTCVSPVFAMTFPKLRSLSLASFIVEYPAQAMAFWERHSTLEFLRITCYDEHIRWFSSGSILPGRFLPMLKHFKAHFYDVRILAPILSQLVSLTVFDSINAQIPYLLRSVLPDGLPNLKSLDICQMPSNSRKNVNIEGALWYETEDGKFHEAKVKKARRDVRNGYIHSILRGAPNLEEIGFRCNIRLKQLAKKASEIAGFSNLRRFYHKGPDVAYDNGPDALTDAEREVVVSNARTLARACNGLTMVVNIGDIELPYVAARISRTECGEVSSVDVGSGYGMQIGSENEAFPESYNFYSYEKI